MMTCPTCGHKPSNSRVSVQLDIPVPLLVSMVHALAIGRNTEMMSSSQEAADEIEKLRKTLFNHLGDSHLHFRERDWTKIMLGAWKGAQISGAVQKKEKRWNVFEVAITVDDRTYISRPKDFSDDINEEQATKILALMLEDIARVTPMV